MMTPEERDHEDALWAAGLASRKTIQIKAETERRIGLLFGGRSGMDLVWAETNVISRAAELADIRHDRPLTPPEEAERVSLKSLKAAVDAIRAASNIIEDKLATDPDLDPAIQADWPV